MFEIREAVEDADRWAVRALIEEYVGTLGFGLDFQDFEGEMAGFPGGYEPPRGALFLAEVGGRPVGCVALRRLDPATCEMKRLYVRPEGRGAGVGRALAEAVIDRARSIGYARMRLDTIASMAAANALYRALGFREIPPYRPNPIAGATFFELDLVDSAGS